MQTFFKRSLGLSTFVLATLTTSHVLAASSAALDAMVLSPSAAASSAANALDRAELQASALRDQILGAAQVLLRAGPDDVAAEYHRAKHFMNVGLPGATSAAASERLLAASLARQAEHQAERSRPFDATRLQFVNLGHTLVVAEAGADIAVTATGNVTVNPAASQAEQSLSPIVPDGVGFTLGFQGPNVANASFGNGSCGNSFKDDGRGRVGLCWWKYRVWDNSTSNDYWAYLGAVTAEPANYSWRRDPYVKIARSASKMTWSSRNTLGYKKFIDHNPRVDSSSNCQNVTVGVGASVGAGNASVKITGVLFCDTWDQYTNGNTSYKRNQFDTGFLGDAGKDIEAAHGSLSNTGQRPWGSYFPSWTDTWWASLCYAIHTNCTTV